MNSEIRRLASAAMRDGAIELEWSDTRHYLFHPIWLGDNCRCAECGDPAVGYCSLYLTSLDLNLTPRSLTYAPDQLKITWEDGHESSYAASWLSEYSYDNSARSVRAFKPEVWNDELRANPPGYDNRQPGRRTTPDSSRPGRSLLPRPALPATAV